MDSKTNRILAKFSKEKGLKKIQLSQVDDIEEDISIGYSNIEFFEEAFDDARTAIIKCNDIVRFELNNPLEDAKFKLDELQQEIKELGVDIPPKVKQLEKEIQALEGAISEAESKNDRLNY